MPHCLNVVDSFVRARDRLRDLDDPDCALLADAIADWLAGAPFGAAQGLAPGWRACVAQRAQRAALAAILRALPAMPARQRAKVTARRLLEYETTRWAADRAVGRCRDARDSALFAYLRTGGPTSAERLRKIQGGGLPEELS